MGARRYFHRNMPVMPAGTANTIIGIWIISTGRKANILRLECSFQDAIIRNTKSTTICGAMLNAHHYHGQARNATHQGLMNIQM